MHGLLTALAATASALILTPVAARMAVRLGVVDRPGALKVHESPVPYLGGLAVFVAAGAAALGGGVRPIWLAPPAVALALGIVDDSGGVPPLGRLASEALIGLGAGLVVPAPGSFGVLITAVFAVALMNAVNLLDGLDGLAAGVALASAIGFAVLGGDGRVLALALAGSLAGFLVFNRPPARIYLGDGGSYMLGVALAMLAAFALHRESEPVYWIVVPLLVAVPLADTAIAIVRRIRARAPIFSGDRGHVYDQLVDRGRSRGQAALLCILTQAILVATGVLAWNLPDALGAAVVVATVAILAVGVVASGFAAPAEHT